MSSPGRTISASACIKEGHRSTFLNGRRTRNAAISSFLQTDSHPLKRAKGGPVAQNAGHVVGALMKTITSRTPVQASAASCLPHQNMRPPGEQVAHAEKQKTRLSGHFDHIFHNSHVMLRSVSSTPYSLERLKHTAWIDEPDKNTLREFFQVPTNIVLHSDCPHIAPHIVITPAEDTPEDFYTPWNNRVDPQRPEYLMVPTIDLKTGRSEVPTCEANHEPDTSEKLTCRPKPVFCYARFNEYVERTANERLIFYHVVKAIQKHRCKAAAYAASASAASFCKRYRNVEFLNPLERPFKWSDPAEPLLLSTKYMSGVTVIESPSPFTVPHIIIHSPPTQNPWIPWHNVISNPQDGRYLTVPSLKSNYFDAVEESETYHKSPTTSAKFFIPDDPEEEEEQGSHYPGDTSCGLAGGHFDEDQLDSPPGSPGPETPTEDSMLIPGFFAVRRSCFVIDEDEEGDCTSALPITKSPSQNYYRSRSVLRTTLPVIEEEQLDVEGISALRPSSATHMLLDEEDDSPPLDDWYLGVVNTRTLTPAAIVA